MGKFYGKVGYVTNIQTSPGVYAGEQITERMYYGDVLEASSKWAAVDQLNDDLRVSVKISVIADEYSDKHFSEIKYCEYMGALWKVVEIKPQRPRLILTLGGVYNGNTP